MHLIHVKYVNLSSEEFMEYASALKVDRTTLPICLEFQATGLTSDVRFSPRLFRHATMNRPCWARNWAADAKLASPKLAKVISLNGIGLMWIAVCDVSFVSLRTRLASSKVETVAFGICFCKNETFAAMSGRLCTAAY